MRVTGSTIEQMEKGVPRGKCRKWRLWATTEHGRRSKRLTGTWTQAQDALTAFVTELEGLVPNSETFASYAASWAAWRRSLGGLSIGTVTNDGRAVRALSRSPLGAMRMDEVTPEDCRAALIWVKEHPQRGDSPLSDTTVSKIGVALKTIMAQAYDDGRIARNPMERVKLPKRDTVERDALSPAELSALLDRLDALPLDGRVVAVYLMACLGLRKSEACGLLDADVRGGMCHVHQAVKERDNSVGETKTPSSVRSLPMPPRLAAKVGEWRALRGALGFPGEYLCCNTIGGMLTMQPLQKWWERTRDAVGVPGMTFHQLRHSNLSMMARHMSPFDLQAYAGWSSIAPAKVYIHRDSDAVKSAVASAWGGIERTKNAPERERSEASSS